MPARCARGGGTARHGKARHGTAAAEARRRPWRAAAKAAAAAPRSPAAPGRSAQALPGPLRPSRPPTDPGPTPNNAFKQPTTAALVVVKTYKPGVIATAEDFRELLMEAGKLSRLSHP
jgi:hypothetical protein